MPNNKNKVAEIIYFLIIGTLLSWSVIAAIVSCTDLTPSYLELFYKVFLACAVYRLIFFNKYTMLVTLAILILAGTLIGGEILISPTMPDHYQQLIDFLNELIDYVMGYSFYQIEYENAIVIAFIVTVPLFFVITMTVSFMFSTIAVTTAIIFSLCFASGFFLLDQAFIVYLICMLVLLMKRLNITHSTQDENTPIRKNSLFTLAVIPVALVCVSVADTIPKPKEPVMAEWVEAMASRPYNFFNDTIYTAFMPKYFSLQSTGYLRTDNRLGGNVRLSDDVVMAVTMTYPHKDRIIGAKKDVYTGYSWLNSTPEDAPFEPDEINGIPRQFAEKSVLLYISALDGGGLNDYVDLRRRFEGNELNFLTPIYGGSFSNDFFEVELSADSIFRKYQVIVDILDNRTCSIFYLDGIESVLFNNAEQIQIYENGIGDKTVKNLLKKGTNYTVNIYEPISRYHQWNINLSKKGIYNVLLNEIDSYEEQYGFEPESFIILHDKEPNSSGHADASSIGMTLAEALRDYLIPYANEQYERYLSLPETFPQRITDLAYALTDDIDTDYEKALEIESFLKRFEYTLSPGDTPSDRDFVDYFLFDLQKGYCTSFATAFVTMCRAIGIPARYVEGYTMPQSSIGNGTYVVTKKQGHAWGEAYFEGYGWYTFEPTPSADEAYSPIDFSEFPEDVAQVYASGDYPYPTMPVYDYEIPTYQQNQDLQNSDAQKSTLGRIIAEMGVGTKLLLSVALLLLLILIYGFVRFIQQLIEKFRLSQKDNNTAAVAYFHKILKYVGFFHYDKFDCETASQYSIRVGKVFSFENDTKFMRDIADIFNKAKYSNAQISDLEREIITRAYETVNRRFRNNVGKYPYLFYKYIAGVI